MARNFFDFGVILMAPAFVTCDDLRKKVSVTLDVVFQILARNYTSIHFFGPL